MAASMAAVRQDTKTNSLTDEQLKEKYTETMTGRFSEFEEEGGKVAVQVDQPGHKVAPTLWGIFFEDINLSADGGIYPELVRNRNFEDADRPSHWSLVTNSAAKAEMSIDTEKPVSPKNPRSRSRSLIRAPAAWAWPTADFTAWRSRRARATRSR